MPPPYAAFRPVHDLIVTPFPKDSARAPEIMQAMADLELEMLAGEGLQNAYGASPPDTLPTTFPFSYRAPAPAGMRFTHHATGQQVQHTGGWRYHEAKYEIYLPVDFREGQDLTKLAIATIKWGYNFDALYSRNGKLGGRVVGIALTGGRFGEIEWGAEVYYGWIFQVDCLAQYQM